MMLQIETLLENIQLYFPYLFYYTIGSLIFTTSLILTLAILAVIQILRYSTLLIRYVIQKIVARNKNEYT